MIQEIDRRLESLGLSKSPFLSFGPESPDFSKVFVDRTKELYKINFAFEYFKTNTNRNLAVIGPSRIGKTTLLQYAISDTRDQFRCLYFEYPLRFNEFCRKGTEFFGNKSGTIPDDARDLGNLFIDQSRQEAGNAIIVIDNFEEIHAFPEDETEGFIRLFRRAGCLFVIACTEKEWGDLLTKYPRLKYAFADEINIQPFSVDNCMDFFRTRIALVRKGSTHGIAPFTEEAARLIGIYSFFIPGRLCDLANKVLFEALTGDTQNITPEFVRSVLAASPVLGSWLSGLNENETRTIEIMIEQNRPVSFEDLANLLSVSRVAAAGYIQKLIERKIVFQLDSPGKKRLFQVTGTFRSTLA
ncbi:MAG: ATP-binding protein [Methanoregula sp.]|nr:ATP-binding protein [Methanoregula sp.]